MTGEAGGAEDRGARARRILSLLDLTSLGDSDTVEDVRALCRAAATPLGTPAAVCVWPRFVGAAREALGEARIDGEVRVATVANFPGGAPDPEAAAQETRAALAAGAHEVDVVFPWRAFLAGDGAVGGELVAACREACGGKARLKVILETGELARPGAIRDAARIAVANGAHFLKTSTGKVPVGATPLAVHWLLRVVAETGGEVGVKISGGVRTVEAAEGYLEQVAEVMGEGWIGPDRVRFGASSLLGELLRDR